MLEVSYCSCSNSVAVGFKKMFNPKSSGKRIVYGAGLGIFLSIVFAEYSSAALYSIYHDSALFRSLTGWSPNKISDIALKISWAIAFLSCWWMIWRLDFLLSFAPHTRSKPTNSKSKKTRNSNGNRVRSDKKRTDNHRKKQKKTRVRSNRKNLQKIKISQISRKYTTVKYWN